MCLLCFGCRKCYLGVVFGRVKKGRENDENGDNTLHDHDLLMCTANVPLDLTCWALFGMRTYIYIHDRKRY